ncbi:hypothetical protein ACMDCT_03815 [Halomonadaceae bacterium KBTZ08]
MKGLRAAIRRGSQQLVGELSWSAPPWLCSLNRLRQQHPRRFWSMVALVVLLPLLYLAGLRLWELVPRPVETTVRIEAPGVTRVDEEGERYPDSLRLHFTSQYEDAREEGPRGGAPLALIGKPLSVGVSLEPDHAGTWRWTDDDTLRFKPDEDWPAGQDYTLTITEAALAEGVHLEDDQPTFATPEIEPDLKKTSSTRTRKSPVNTGWSPRWGSPLGWTRPASVST